MMSSRTRRRALGAAVALLVTTAGARGDVDPLGEDEFERLHADLAPTDEAWRRLPWEASILAANERAAREAKPIFMLVRSGNPLGCV